MVLYREWCQKVEDRRGRMVPVDTIPKLLKLNDPGYASVYAFNEEDALKIKTSGSSKGLDQYSVTADQLIVDIDNGLEGLQPVQNYLDKNNIAYELWSSGGKGFHIYIPHEPITSKDLPYSHKATIEQMGLKVDTSLYQHGRLISLPGRVHPKTRNRKKKLEIFKGNPIAIQLISKPEPKFSLDDRFEANLLSVGLTRILGILSVPPNPGNRHTALWGAAKDLAEAGLTFDTVLDIMNGVNDSWEDKKGEDEIRLAVSQAFKNIIEK